MPKTQKQILGKKGETLAVKYLQKLGHRIIVRNFRHIKSELDIISLFNDTLVVSEVKSFYSQPLGAAEFRVNKAKQRQIIKGTYAFLDRFPQYREMSVRFDVLTVDFSNFPAKISHHEAAFWDEQGWD